MSFDNPIHPHIQWPNSEKTQTAQEGVNLTDEPTGPKVGDPIRWTTTSPNFPELFWVRKTIEVDGVEQEKSKESEEPEKQNPYGENQNPLDGKWRVEWDNKSGGIDSVEIHVKKSEYLQSGYPFHVTYSDPKHPHIQWPNSKKTQTIQEGIDLIEEPMGPKVGGRIRWTTTSPNFPELSWIRKTIEVGGVKQKTEKEASEQEKKKTMSEEGEVKCYNPMDGKWNVEWADQQGKAKKTKIHVKDSEYMQSGFPFHLNFDDPLHPFIPWPNSEYLQTVQEGVNLTEEPFGPKVGGRIRWTSTSPNFPELYWIRKTIEADGAPETSEEDDAGKKKKKKKESTDRAKKWKEKISKKSKGKSPKKEKSTDKATGGEGRTRRQQ